MPNLDADLVPTREAAHLLGVSVKTVIRWATEEHRLDPVSKLPGLRGAYLFKRADIEALLSIKQVT